MSDKLDITELLYRYAEFIDAGDFDGVGALLSKVCSAAPDPRESPVRTTSPSCSRPPPGVIPTMATRPGHVTSC